MDNIPVKNPFDGITPEEVYEEARSLGSIERIFEDFKSCVKNSNSYITLMEATKQTILCDNYLTMPIRNKESTKKRIHEIGLLASQFHASVSDFFSATIEVEGRPIIEKIIKQRSFLKRESASNVFSPNKKEQATINHNSAANNVRHNEKKPRTSKGICEANGDSSESVSSVHTSELSSLSDEVVVSSEDHSGKKPKIISFKSVNNAYKSLVEEKNKTPIKRRRVRSTSKTCVSSGLNGSDESDTLPKRKRKPNSRYTSK